ncbi:NAD(P)H-binding protein [Streptomyces bobili]|uniref:NAD(P)H-binding protein n=1 Tax=Streptomyces bobili TaxID=67280 RepID=UPI003794BCAD
MALADLSLAHPIGATGGVGSLLAAQLNEQGDHVVGLHRHTGQAHTLESDGTKPFLGDLTSLSADTPAARLEGASAVVFTAGASGAARDRRTPSTQGVEVTATAAAKGGVGQFLPVSAFVCAARPTGHVSLCGGWDIRRSL